MQQLICPTGEAAAVQRLEISLTLPVLSGVSEAVHLDPRHLQRLVSNWERLSAVEAQDRNAVAEQKSDPFVRRTIGTK